MKNKLYPILASSSLILGMLACNLPGGQSANQPDLAGTITAQALILQGPSSTPAPLSTPTIATTFTPSVPEVSVSSPTNCRSGPGTAFDLIFTMNAGQTVQVIGKNTPDNYWIINNPGGGTCWLWGQYAILTGNTAGLPEYSSPPTPTPSAPAAPKNFKGETSCMPGKFLTTNVHVTLTWVDVATNEDGYHIFRNNSLLATLGPNSTSFADDTTFHTILIIIGKTPPPPPTVTYGIEAFNSAGKSSLKQVTLGCK